MNYTIDASVFIASARSQEPLYVAVAEEFATTLVTWDGEMLQRGAALVTTITPDDWLKTQQTTPSQSE